tara:strand:+ start:1049 stop:1939 length:891 start_codon:yes stop_codon:yes gene_type:complete
MSFSSLKKRSGTSLEKLVQEAEKLNKQGPGADERFWKPELDKSGNGYAVIRFLPAPDGEELPWAKVYSHAFQGSGGWYIENSLTTVNKKDPVGEVNRKLWNSGLDSDKDIARKQKRKLSYYTNIQVVRDPAHPENEGKVFLYKFGKKIYDKITAAMQPEFEDETPINPFDLWEGANFKLKICKVAGFWNYDKSEFDSPSALASDDAELEAVWKKEYSLTAFTADDQFKSYEELQTRLNEVLGTNKRAAAPTVDSEEYEPVAVAAATPTPATRRAETAPTTSEDDQLSYFARLAEED